MNQIDAASNVERHCGALMRSLAPNADHDAWEAPYNRIGHALEAFTNCTVHLKWEITGHVPKSTDRARSAS
ncbi:hypothetical protein [Streptomyces sp. NBC_01276]|uniref:hypothetical protein n=1 Tax=Streptomyces sp. NBC_01276 TaxID=2903808 RepID=UPI00352E5F52